MNYRYLIPFTIAVLAMSGCDDGDGTCYGHDDCPLSQVCIASECVPAYGRDYRITIVGADLPESTSGGASWDWPGGLPDAYATFSDTDGNSCSTGFIDNTLSPTWNHVCPLFRINESSRYRWRIYDADDVSDDERIAGTASGSEFQIELEWIKDGGFRGTWSRGSIDFDIEPM
jgi:hypothetical protein